MFRRRVYGASKQMMESGKKSDTFSCFDLAGFLFSSVQSNTGFNRFQHTIRLCLCPGAVGGCAWPPTVPGLKNMAGSSSRTTGIFSCGSASFEASAARGGKVDVLDSLFGYV